MLVLRRLELKDEKTFLKALASWDGSPDFMFHRGFKEGDSYKEYLNFLEGNERGVGLPEGWVPDTSLFGFVNDEVVGRLSLRHHLIDWLKLIGGHIGYGVLPQHRNKGYAKEMLMQSLPFAKEIGIDKVLVTCDDDNIASAKVIEACGGVLENKVVQPERANKKVLKRRYWIKL